MESELCALDEGKKGPLGDQAAFTDLYRQYCIAAEKIPDTELREQRATRRAVFAVGRAIAAWTVLKGRHQISIRQMKAGAPGVVQPAVGCSERALRGAVCLAIWHRLVVAMRVTNTSGKTVIFDGKPIMNGSTMPHAYVLTMGLSADYVETLRTMLGNDLV